MKVPAEIAVDIAAPSEGRGAFAIWSEIFKARLSALVLLTTAVGFHMGSRDPMDYALLAQTLFGTALLAAGAAALNQYLEREYDARMPRTAHRPLPTGEVRPRTVLVVGTLVSVAGMLELTFRVNSLAGVLGMLTLATYVFVYTPLKRITTLNTLVGAVPGVGNLFLNAGHYRNGLTLAPVCAEMLLDQILGRDERLDGAAWRP